MGKRIHVHCVHSVSDTRPRNDEEHVDKTMPVNKCSFCPSQRGHNDGQGYVVYECDQELENYMTRSERARWWDHVLDRLKSHTVTFTTPYPCTQVDIIYEDKSEYTICNDCGDIYCWGGVHCSAREQGNMVTRWLGNMWTKVRYHWDRHGACSGG
jgi:hypothetical protein